MAHGSLDVAGWIDACNETYEQDTKKYHPSTQIGAQFGWDINVFDVDGWNAARFPVCDIYGAVRVHCCACDSCRV